MITLLWALACAGDDKGTYTPPDETGETGEGEGEGEGEPEGTDEDGDGWTVEEGDCDDTSIYVNPAWDEDDSDGIDNDCDGRIDEVWSGFTVVWLNGEEGGGTLLSIDTLGERREDEDQELDGSCAILGIDRNPDGITVVNNYGALATLEDGVCTDLGDFSELDYGLNAVGVLPDGTLLGLTGDALWEVGSDGTLSALASWNADNTDTKGFERYGDALAVNQGTGEVGIADRFGGFAVWSAEGGLENLVEGDTAAPPVVPSALAARDGGGWAALATDTSSGALGVYDVGEDGWSLRVVWEDTSRTPYTLTTEGGTQDAYVISNAGQRGRVWRVRYESGEQGKLYETDAVQNWYFTGILTDYQ